MGYLLKEHFPDIISYTRPKIELLEIFDPYWLAGFAEGDGCVYISIQKYKSTPPGPLRAKREFD